MLVVALMLVLWSTPTARATTTIDVNTTSDVINANDNLCSLREAIIAANSDTPSGTGANECPAGSGNDIIHVPGGTYHLTRVGSDDNAQNGDLDLTAGVTLNGAGSASTIIDGNGSVTFDRVFHVLTATVTISGVAVQKGNVASGKPGGGILNEFGTLTVTHSAVMSNTASGVVGGGGIANWIGRTLTVINSTVRGNSTTSHGGGIFNASQSSVVTIIGSTISGNTANSNGGAITNNCLNTSLTIVNSTLSANRARQDGGAIYNCGMTNLYNVTIAHNTADYDGTGDGNGGGVSNPLGSGPLTSRNSVIALNTDASPGVEAPDCGGNLTSPSYTLVGNNAGCTGITDGVNGNKVGTGANPLNPQLGSLQYNGGATFTHALLLGSPAINAGNPTGCLDHLGMTLTIDQRGFARPIALTCDMGALEAGMAVFLPLILR
jgi:CSLREA domain-containing protein